jgi:hypothetical protein
MAFELEALVGHIYLVGGRTISAAPPGALVEVAPKKAARGREGDTFFCLVLPALSAHAAAAPTVFYEEMAALAAERYFDSTGGVTSALRDTINHLNENLYAHNSGGGTRYEAHLICAALRGTEIYIAKAGAGAAALRYRGEMFPFPTNFDNSAAIQGTALGALSVIEPRMTRYIIGSGARFVLCDPSLASLPLDTIEDALSRDDIGGALVWLRDALSRQQPPPNQLALLMAECVAPEMPDVLPVRAAETTASLSGRTRQVETALATESAASNGTAPSAPSPAADAAPQTSASRSAARSTPRPAEETRYVAGAVAGSLASIVGGAGKLLDRVVPLPAEQENKRGISSAAGLAVLIPLGVVALVVILWLTGTGESEFDGCVRRAADAAALARGIDSSDVTGTLSAWNATLLVVDECSQLRADDPQMAVLLSEGRAIVDTLMRIERRDVTPVETFPNALITRIILQGSDMYTLDSRNQQVYRVTLSNDGLSTIPGTRQPLPAMRRGGTINQYSVSDLIDIGWTEDGTGFAQGNVLVALDRSGLLIDCAPRFLGDCNAQRILGTETWISPKSITFWQGRMYVLDPGANQLWRYDPLGGSFPNAPTEYFTGEGRPDIRGAVDVSIDEEGFVYILGGDGSIRRFRTGAAESFGYANFPENTPPANASSFFLNTNPVRQGIFIVDQPGRTIYEITLAGTFIASFRTYNEDLFAQLNDVAVDSSQEIIYAASGNGVLALRRLLGLPEGEETPISPPPFAGG